MLTRPGTSHSMSKYCRGQGRGHLLTALRRMEACVQRFRGRRRLDQTKVQFFNEYLFLGGIDTGPRQFTGLDKADLTEMTTTEIRDLKAVDRIVHGGGCGKFYDPSNPEHWDVDFKGVAAGFL